MTYEITTVLFIEKVEEKKILADIMIRNFPYGSSYSFCYEYQETVQINLGWHRQPFMNTEYIWKYCKTMKRESLNLVFKKMFLQ